MTGQMNDQADDVGLSAVLRNLAVDARRMLLDGATDPADAQGIAHRIRSVRDRVHPYPTSSLQRWLDVLERKVQSALLGRVAS